MIIEFFKSRMRGVMLAALIALAAAFIADHYGGPVMLFAILFGIAFNFLSDDEKCAPGIQFASKRLLQLGVILLGATITFGEVAALGWRTAGVVVGAVTLLLIVGTAIARSLKLSKPHAFISSAAVAICGASAAMAVAAVLPQNSRNERALVMTVVGVTALSTLAMIFYPPLTDMLGLSDKMAGIFLGATIHDVAQVVGAGYIVSDDAGATAAIVKLLRVTLLAPTVLAIAIIFARTQAASAGIVRAFPVFLVGFFALITVNSIVPMPELLTRFLSDASRWCLIVAVSALGLKTSLRELFEMGPVPSIVLFLQTLLLLGFVTLAVLFLFP